LVGIPLFTLPELPETRRDAVLAAHPDDFDLQFAGALDRGRRKAKQDGKEEWEGTRHTAQQLLPLAPRFNDRPAFHAHVLRFLSGDAVYLQRDEERLSSRYTGPSDWKKPHPLRPVDLRAFLHAAARGEELDPENAYFPAMATVGYLVAERDKEAFAALERAASCPKYEDYSSEEAWARINWETKVRGEIGAANRYLTSMSGLTPHYRSLRALSRTVTGLAIQAEQVGQTAKGLALRRNVARLGAVMREESIVRTGAIVGMNMITEVAKRPGGVPLPPESPQPFASMGEGMPSMSGPGMDGPAGAIDGPVDAPNSAPVPSTTTAKSPAERLQDERAEYLSYLNRIGAKDEAQRYAAECIRNDAERGNEQFNVDSEGFTRLDRGIERLGRLWGVGFFLLLNTFWMLIAGGVSALWARSSRIRKGLSCRPAVRGGMVYAAIYPLLYSAAASLVNGGIHEYFEVMFLVGGGVTLAVAVLPFFVLKRGVNWSAYAGRLAWFAGGISGVYLVAGAIYGSTQGIMNALFDDGYECMSNPLAMFRLAAIWPCLMVYSLAAVVPLITIARLAIRAIRQCVPASVGIARGLPCLAGWLVAGTLFSYAVTVCLTAREEARVSAMVARMVENEKKFFLEASGMADYPRSDG
jgi:hypothetical protein